MKILLVDSSLDDSRRTKPRSLLVLHCVSKIAESVSSRSVSDDRFESNRFFRIGSEELALRGVWVALEGECDWCLMREFCSSSSLLSQLISPFLVSFKLLTSLFNCCTVCVCSSSYFLSVRTASN